MYYWVTLTSCSTCMRLKVLYVGFKQVTVVYPSLEHTVAVKCLQNSSKCIYSTSAYLNSEYAAIISFLNLGSQTRQPTSANMNSSSNFFLVFHSSSFMLRCFFMDLLGHLRRL